MTWHRRCIRVVCSLGIILKVKGFRFSKLIILFCFFHSRLVSLSQFPGRRFTDVLQLNSTSAPGSQSSRHQGDVGYRAKVSVLTSTTIHSPSDATVQVSGRIQGRKQEHNTATGGLFHGVSSDGLKGGSCRTDVFSLGEKICLVTMIVPCIPITSLRKEYPSAPLYIEKFCLQGYTLGVL